MRFHLTDERRLPELCLGRGARVAEEAHEAIVVCGEQELPVPSGVRRRYYVVVVRVVVIIPRAGDVVANGRSQVVPFLVSVETERKKESYHPVFRFKLCVLAFLFYYLRATQVKG